MLNKEIIKRMSIQMNKHNLLNKIEDNIIILENGLILDFEIDENSKDRYNYSPIEENNYIFLNTNKSKAESEIVSFFELFYKRRIIESIGLSMFEENIYYFMWENNLDFGIENKRDLCIEHFKIKYNDKLQKFTMFNDFTCHGHYSKHNNLRINFILDMENINIEILVMNKNQIISIHKNRVLLKSNKILNDWFEETILPYGLTLKGVEAIGLNSISEYTKEHYMLYKVIAY